MEKSFNNLVLTEDSIEKTRKHFYDISLKNIDDILKGETYLYGQNEINKHIDYELILCEDYLLGKMDNKIYFLQYAYYVQTGISLPLISQEVL